MARTQSRDSQIRLDGNTIRLSGRWTSESLERALTHIPRKLPPTGVLTVDLAEISALDTSGAWFIERSVRSMRHDGREVEFANLSASARSLLELVAAQVDPREARVPAPHFTVFERTGHATMVMVDNLYNYVGFIGEAAWHWLRVITLRRHWRMHQLYDVVEQTGVTAVPIIALLSFLIGLVLAYEGLVLLSGYGASLFIVNFTGLAVFREFGPLIAAIVVAGRTGSSFTAQLGTMKVSEEVDALVAMGLSPVEVLVLPRIFGLVIAMPLLTVLADLAGMVGAMFAATVVAGIEPGAFIDRLNGAISVSTVVTGVVKAPVFALVIASVGCFHGFKAESSAESVGKRTTQSVVQSIFFVIVIDAAFAILYSAVGI
ncbi:MAG: MlaE family lipid ABC transporter permease subunit [Gammaproteobacteria bacterium]|nr:MlaE family lipid ABC transporter permease subunit [Gammaproteobacteria bacterium]